MKRQLWRDGGLGGQAAEDAGGRENAAASGSAACAHFHLIARPPGSIRPEFGVLCLSECIHARFRAGGESYMIPRDAAIDLSWRANRKKKWDDESTSKRPGPGHF